jgi:hypothetical protein
MSVSGTQSTTYSFQKGGGSMAVSSAVSLGNDIVSNEANPQNLSLGQNVPRIPKLVTPVTGTQEVFDVRPTMFEDDNEVYSFSFAAAANCVDTHVMVANYEYIVDSVKAKFVTASSSGTIDVKICDDGQAPSAGTSVLSSTISIAGTADTSVSGTLTTTEDDRKISKGKSIALDFGGTVTSIAGLVVTLVLRRVIVPGRTGNYLE